MLAAGPSPTTTPCSPPQRTVAATLTEADWLEAFAAHPLIGDVDSLRKKYAATKQLAAGEQSGVAGAERSDACRAWPR